MSFTVGAYTIYGGSVSVSYGASSVTKTQARGSTLNWYLYYVDPTAAGGSQTLFATTTQSALAQQDGVVFIGACQITMPSGSAGGSGSQTIGGGGGAGLPIP